MYKIDENGKIWQIEEHKNLQTVFVFKAVLPIPENSLVLIGGKWYEVKGNCGGCKQCSLSYNNLDCINIKAIKHAFCSYIITPYRYFKLIPDLKTTKEELKAGDYCQFEGNLYKNLDVSKNGFCQECDFLYCKNIGFIAGECFELIYKGESEMKQELKFFSEDGFNYIKKINNQKNFIDIEYKSKSNYSFHEFYMHKNHWQDLKHDLELWEKQKEEPKPLTEDEVREMFTILKNEIKIKPMKHDICDFCTKQEDRLIYQIWNYEKRLLDICPDCIEKWRKEKWVKNFKRP